jgi:hypothetical protein
MIVNPPWTLAGELKTILRPKNRSPQGKGRPVLARDAQALKNYYL